MKTSQERLSVGRRRVKQIQEGQLFFRGKERGFEGVPRQLPQMLFGKTERLLRQLVFARSAMYETSQDRQC